MKAIRLVFVWLMLSAAVAVAQPSNSSIKVGGSNVSNSNPVPMSDAGGSLTVDGTVTCNAGTGTLSTNLAQIAGNTASAGNGVSGTGVQRVTVASDSTGTLACTQATASSLNAQVVGSVAHDGVDAGNPVKIGGQARSTNPAKVADADRSNLITDLTGKQIAVSAIRELKAVQKTTITSSTSETTIVSAAGASVFADLYLLVITNTSATASTVAIKDATAGTTRFTFDVPAHDTRGFALDAGSSIVQATANNNWTATCGSSVASIEITAGYVKNL